MCFTESLHCIPDRKIELSPLSTRPTLFFNWFTHFGLALCAFILGGCATNNYPSAPTAEDPNSASHQYHIGPGDSLNVIVRNNADVSMAVSVRPDGTITTPLVEDMPASGKTPSVLARDIEKALSQFIQEPKVTVIVTAYSGPYGEQIRVIGQAAKPQALPYRQGMSVLDVMIAVGGITEFAAGNKANIIRTVDGKQQKFAVRLNDLIKDGDVSANVPVRPGDILVIPESFF